MKPSIRMVFSARLPVKGCALRLSSQKTFDDADVRHLAHDPHDAVDGYGRRHTRPYLETVSSAAMSSLSTSSSFPSSLSFSAAFLAFSSVRLHRGHGRADAQDRDL